MSYFQPVTTLRGREDPLWSILLSGQNSLPQLGKALQDTRLQVLQQMTLASASLIVLPVQQVLNTVGPLLPSSSMSTGSLLRCVGGVGHVPQTPSRTLLELLPSL